MERRPYAAGLPPKFSGPRRFENPARKGRVSFFASRGGGAIIAGMSNLFIYWDHSNIFIRGKTTAALLEGGAARDRFRINFPVLLQLAQAGRHAAKVLVAGSRPSGTEEMWDAMRAQGAEVRLFDKGDPSGKEQEVPDYILQLQMLQDGIDHSADPGVAVILTGDGKGRDRGDGFYANAERLQKLGWGVEILAWESGCHRGMREWAKSNGVFIPLDDYYNAATFIQSTRPSSPLDLSRRPTAG